jgi:hypothetical protein
MCRARRIETPACSLDPFTEAIGNFQADQRRRVTFAADIACSIRFFVISRGTRTMRMARGLVRLCRRYAIVAELKRE